MDWKVHCLSRKASYTLFIHGFNRQSIFLVFPDSEAVACSGVFILSVKYIYIYLLAEQIIFYKENIKILWNS